MIFKRIYPELLLKTFCFTMLSVFAFAKPPVTAGYSVELKNIGDTSPVSDKIMDGKIYESVEEEAYFAGGEASWLSYLLQNLNPAVPVEKGAKPVFTLLTYNL